jgi:hypothetical protein
MALFRARPALGWVILVALLVLGGGSATGALGAAVAACFYPSTPEEPFVY